MALGVLLPLYAFFNLSLNQYFADVRYKKFVKEKENISSDDIIEFKKFYEDYSKKLGENSGNIVDPFDYNDYQNNYGLDLKNKDKIFGYVKIPKIDAVKPIRFDASYENLSKGLAHIDGTSLPVGGIGTRSVIAGHRGWYTDVMFLNLHKLKNGDEIFIELIDGTNLKYVVKDSEIITPYEWEKITPIPDKDMLTLLTCDPITPPSPYRLIINCERVVENKTINYNSNFSMNKVFENVEMDKTVKLVKYGIYGITIVLICVLFFVLFILIRYTISKRRKVV